MKTFLFLRKEFNIIMISISFKFNLIFRFLIFIYISKDKEVQSRNSYIILAQNKSKQK